MVPSARFVRLRRVSRVSRPFRPRRGQVHLPPAGPPGRPGTRRDAIGNFSTAADCASTLRLPGVAGRRRHARRARGDDRRTRAPRPGTRRPRPLDAGNSGSTLRMLAGALAGRPFRSTLTGDASLRRRPMERVAVPLRAMGARVQTTDGRPPLTIEGGRLRGHRRGASTVASAQVKTAVLLAGLQADGTTTRARAARRAATTRSACCPPSACAVRDGRRRALGPPPATCARSRWTCPGDVSSAAFLVVAALMLPDSHVRVERRAAEPAAAPRSSTCCARWAATSTVGVDSERAGAGGLDRGALVAAARDRRSAPAVVPALIDEVPALAVAAALRRGHVHGVGRRRAARQGERPHRGAGRGPRRDGRRGRGASRRLRDRGRPAAARRLASRSHGDHRIAMALAVAALAARRRDRDRGRATASPSPSRTSTTSLERGARPAEPPPTRVVLVGFMGAGKSTVGPEVARAAGLGVPATSTAGSRRAPGLTRGRDLPRRGARPPSGPRSARAAPSRGRASSAT